MADCLCVAVEGGQSGPLAHSMTTNLTCAMTIHGERISAAAYSNAALGEKLFGGQLIFCRRLVIRHDKTLRGQPIKNFSLISIQIRSLQHIAKDRNFFISDDGIRHYTAPGV